MRLPFLAWAISATKLLRSTSQRYRRPSWRLLHSRRLVLPIMMGSTGAFAEHTLSESTVWRFARKLINAWDALQIELHGQYPLSRIDQLHIYKQTTSNLRVVLMCLITPAPCLVLVALLDMVPLKSPREGVYKNYVFWIRDWLAVAFITVAILQQFSKCLPKLPMSNQAMATLTVIGTTAGVGCQFVCARFIGFPLPFSMVFGEMMWTPAVVISCGFLWGKLLLNDRTLLGEMLEYVVVLLCQVALTLIYPAYIYVFNSLTGLVQNGFVVMLTVIKLGTKNWISRFLNGVDELKPEVIIFNIEVFNALYVSCSLSTASSATTTALVMVIDLMQSWISLTDIDRLNSNLHRILAKLPQDVRVATANDNFMAVSVELLKDPQVREHTRLQVRKTDSFFFKIVRARAPPIKYAAPPTIPEEEAAELAVADRTEPQQLVKKSALPPPIKMRSATVVPTSDHEVDQLPSQDPTTKDAVSVSSMSKLVPATRGESPYSSLSLHDRVSYVETAARLLFLTECVMLVEFTEVIMPIIYCVYLIAMSNVPNRQFYPRVAAMSEDELYATIASVLVYSLLEFVSLVVFALLINRKLKISTLHQVSFVLDKQFSSVQSKLILWTFYVVQCMLEHFGVDFSMKFAWLKSSP